MRRREKIKDTLTCYLFIAPALFFFTLFIGGPILVNLFVLSFTRYNILNPPQFIGFQNFSDFFRDPMSGKIFYNTVKYAVILLTAHLIIGLLLALGVFREKNKKLRYFYRTAIYFPSIVSTASVAIAWAYMYDKDYGVINYFLQKIGIINEGIPWLTSTKWSIPAVAIFSIWKFVGNNFLYYLVGLQNIPTSCYEAALIDGATPLQIFRYIILPLLTPTIFFVSTILLIGTMQIFDEPYLITHGGPGDSSRTIALYIYEKAFKYYDMGYASTIASVLFILLLILTILQFVMQKKWVIYEYE